jgi:hypothetical protein
MKTNHNVCWLDVCMVRVVSLSKAKFLFEFADDYLKKFMTRILHLCLDG